MNRLMPDNRLDNFEIRKKLLEVGINESVIDEVLQQFWFQDFLNSFVSFPEYYVILEKYLLKKNSLPFSRPDFYGFFFKEMFGETYKLMFPKVQKLALVFENAHTDAVSLINFPDVIKKIGGFGGLDAKSALTVDAKLAVIQDVKDATDNPYFVWKHHTLTEYLVSTMILEDANPIRCAASLMVLNQEGVVAFKNSWYGTLRFLIESDQGSNFTKWLLEFGEENPGNIDDQFGQILLWSNPENIDSKTRGRIFDLIYKNYQNKRLWIPVWSRERISTFALPDHLKVLEKDIEPTKDPVETFVHKGNVVAVIDGFLKSNNPILTAKSKDVWKKLLVEYANDKNENGVLQRHALDALESYKDPRLVEQVDTCLKHPDSLVREAFVQFAYKTAPNSVKTVGYVTEAIKNGMTIYGRYGLYEITEKGPLLVFIENLATDASFREEFLDRENIFNGDKENGDKQLIKHIEVILDREVAVALKKFIKAAFDDNEKWYLADDSEFVAAMASLILKIDPDYPLEVVSYLQSLKKDGESKALYNYDGLLPMLFAETKMEEFLKGAAELDMRGGGSDWIVYTAKRKFSREDLYKYAVEHKLVTPLKEAPLEDKFQTPSKLERFHQYLEPQPGKYLPEVFSYFVESHQEIEKEWSAKSKSRFIKLIKDSLEKIDPKEINVKISDKGKHPNQYTISSVGAYFGKVFAAAHIVCPEVLNKHRDKVINFIPYAYSDDQQTILKVVERLEDKDLSFVNAVYQNKEDDRRYLIPSSYLRLVEEYLERRCLLPSVKDVLQSLFEDKLLSDQDRCTALDLWGKTLSNNDEKSKATIKSLFEDEENSEFKETANALLISVFKDEDAIKWRLDQIKARIVPVKRQGQFEARSISREELELDSLGYAKPLIDLKDPKYLTYFLDLLDYSLKVINKDTLGDKWAYGNYLWKITIEFVVNLKTLGSFKPLLELQNWFEKKSPSGESRWLAQRLVDLRKEYTNYLGAKKLYDND